MIDPQAKHVTQLLRVAADTPVESLATLQDSAHLLLNDELPIFPGSGGVEYLTTIHMPPYFRSVGLVSMVHRRADLEHAEVLRRSGVGVYLWQSPALDGTPPAARVSWLRRVHGWLSTLLIACRAWPDRPLDAARADSTFRNLAGPLARAFRDRPWPIVTVVQSHAADFIRHIPRPSMSILVMHDVRALVYGRRAAITRSRWRRRHYERQATKYHAFERALCREYDVVVTVSDNDAQFVRTQYEPRHVVTRRLPIDASYWAPRPDVAPESALIVFTGLMSHPPNVDAATYMARDVLPLIRAEVPDAALRIVGRHPAPEVLALAKAPGVSVTGEVQDVRPHVEQATIIVVPLRFGSGARQKILEAWAMGKCVVSTTIGAEGLNAIDGQHLAIADSAEQFARTAIRALRDPEWRHGLSRAGRSIVTSVHDPRVITEGYIDAIAAVHRQKRKEAAGGPMRVAVDMRWMLPGIAGGIEQVARSFVRELLAVDHHNRYTLIVPAQVAPGLDVRRNPNVRVTSVDGARAYLDRLGRAVRRRLLGALHLDDWQSDDVRQLAWVRSLGAEMVYAFPGYTHPDVQLLPQVLMVPDIQHEYFPEFFSPAALEERTRVYRDSIGRATHLCAISEFTRQTVIEKLGVNENRITTIPLAADPIFGPRAEPEDASVLRRFALEAGSYWFFPGHTWRHKNHLTAVRAVALARDEYGVRLPLVCTGGRREAHARILEEIERLGLAHVVRWLGYVPGRNLPALYRNAAALLFPSLFEGFGMPVLEAMACACPVVCSNTTSLPEIAGNAAVLVDPLDDDAVACALRAVTVDRERRETLVAAGLARAGMFSWRRHTLDTLQVLRDTRARLL